MKIFSSILFSFMLLLSCENQPKDKFSIRCFNDTSFKVYYPKSLKFFEDNTSKQNLFLGLNSINHKSDTFTLRIHKGDNSCIKILEYRDYSGKSNVLIYSYPVDPDGFILFDSCCNNLRRYKTFESGFQNSSLFKDKLDEFRILNLEHFANYNAFATDGYTYDSYEIEFSNSCYYRTYCVWELEKNLKYHKDAKDFYQFLEFLKKKYYF